MLTGLEGLIFCTFILMAIGLYKKDFALIFFSATLSMLTGLNILTYGFYDIASTTAKDIGIIFIFIGVYLMIRSAIETFRVDKKEKR